MVQQFRSASGHIKTLPEDEKRQGKVYMEKLNSPKHWTGESTDNFVHRIASDFLAQVETKIEKGEISRSELARRLDRSPGRVSQLFNPGNITISSAVRLVRAMNMKVALVAYDDNDPENQRGPVNSEIFSRCWQLIGGPRTFYELANQVAPIELYGWQHEAANLETTIRMLAPDRSASTRGHSGISLPC
jgi:hypothetical protein